MTKNDKYLSKEKFILFSVTFAFLFVILLLFFTPQLVAQSKDQELNEKIVRKNDKTKIHAKIELHFIDILYLLFT